MLHEIISNRPSMQASHPVGPGTTTKGNQPASQIAARYKIFPQLVSITSILFMMLVGIDPGICRLHWMRLGEIVSH